MSMFNKLLGKDKNAGSSNSARDVEIGKEAFLPVYLKMSKQKVCMINEEGEYLPEL